MKVSDELVQLVGEFEGFRDKAYKCPADVWTIGYGFTKGVKPGDTITKAEADVRLKRELNEFSAGICKYITVFLTQNQFDALVSFAYNIGLGAFKDSTLLRKLNARDYAGAAEQFPRWNKAGGKVLNGLVNRRARERELFLKKTEY